MKYINILLVASILFASSCSKKEDDPEPEAEIPFVLPPNGGGTPGAIIFSYKLDGTLIEYRAGGTGLTNINNYINPGGYIETYFDANQPGIGLNVYINGGNFSDITVNQPYYFNTGAPIYGELYYDSNEAWTTDNTLEAGSVTITNVNLADSTASGTFSGTLYDMGTTGTNTRVITEGVFYNVRFYDL